jgi:hypothetical protein
METYWFDSLSALPALLKAAFYEGWQNRQIGVRTHICLKNPSAPYSLWRLNFYEGSL